MTAKQIISRVKSGRKVTMRKGKVLLIATRNSKVNPGVHSIEIKGNDNSWFIAPMDEPADIVKHIQGLLDSGFVVI